MKIEATVQRDDGAVVEMEVLRPRAWAEEQGVVAGREIHLALAELGVNGIATITRVAP